MTELLNWTELILEGTRPQLLGRDAVKHKMSKVFFNNSFPFLTSIFPTCPSKNPPANTGDIRDTGSIPGQEDSLEQEMATHSSIFAWRSPWTEEPRGLQSIGLQRVRQDWSYLAHTRPSFIIVFEFSVSLSLPVSTIWGEEPHFICQGLDSIIIQ